MSSDVNVRVGIEGQKEFNNSIKDMTRNLKTLDSEMKKVESAFGKSTSAMDKAAKKSEVLKKKQELLTQEHKELEAALKNAEDTYGTNSAAAEKWRQKLNACETELNNVNNELKNNSPAEAWKQQLQDVGSTLESVGKKFQSVGKTLSVAVTAPLVGLGTKAVTSFAEVDKTMQLTTATMGATADEADLLSDAMKDAAANSVFGMTDAAEASLNFARAGLTAEEAAAALAPAMNLAAGEGGDLDTVSAGLVATINGFGGSFSEATAYADVFANACNNSALDINSLSDSMSIAAPIFAAAGYSVNDAALYMGVMANAGIDANTAATSLKTGFARLVSPTDEAADKMKELGLSVVNSDGTMKDSVQIQEELHNAFAGLSDSEKIAAASAIFGKNQMSNWLALIETAPEDVQSLSDALDEEGTTAEMAETMMSGFGGSLEKLKSSADVAMTSFGEALAPTISEVADKVQGLVDWFNNLDDGEKEQIAKIAMIAAAVGPLLIVLGTVIGTIGKIVGGVGTLMPVIAGLNPVVLGVIAGVMAAIAVGGLIMANWDKISAALSEFGEGLKKGFEEIGENVTKLKEGFDEKFDAIKTKVGEVWEGVKSKTSETMNELKTFTGNTLSSMQKTFEEKGGGIRGASAALMTGLQSVYTAGFNKLDSISGGKLTAIKNAFTNTFNTAKSIVSNALERIKGLFNFTWSFPKLKMPHFSWSWQSIGGLVSIPKISVSWYAKAMDDGMILKRPTIFGASGGSLLGAGEAGSETVVGTGSLIGMIRQAVREGMGFVPDAAGTTNYGGVTVNVYGAPGQDVEELADIIEERMTANVLRREGAWA